MKKIILSLMLIVGIFDCYAVDNRSNQITFDKLPICTSSLIITKISQGLSLKEAIENFYNLRLLSKQFNEVIKNRAVKKVFITNCINKFGENAFKDLIIQLAEKINRKFYRSKSFPRRPYKDLDKDLNKMKLYLRNYKLVKNRNLNLGKDKIFEVLINAVVNNNTELVKLLLKAGVNVDTRDHNGCTILMRAVYSNTTELVKILLEFNADVNARDFNQWTALIHAAYNNGNVKVIKLLLKAGADVNARNRNQWTALIYAVYNNGNVKVIKSLLKAGADVNARDSRQYHALRAAVENNNVELVIILLEANANVNIIDNDGLTPLSWCNISLFGSSKIATILANNNGVYGPNHFQVQAQTNINRVRNSLIIISCLYKIIRHF